jgi:glycosyltransferase involved in cell wall biosynthesis
MSDTPGPAQDGAATEEPYQQRSEDELKSLEQQFRHSPIRNYVAPPADGYDVHGLWSCFGTQHRTGYATHAMALHWMLSKSLGIKTQLTPHRSMDIDIERFPKDRDTQLFAWTKEAVGWPQALFVSFPLEVAAEMEDAGPAVVPYCAFEGDKISRYAVDLATGPIFKRIMVVSDFVKSAFTAAGVPEDRVDVVRPMLTDGFWKMTPMEQLAAAKNRPVTHDDPFVLGTLGTWQKRKGMFDLVRAYFSNFKREEPVTLVIRTSPLNSNLTIKKFKEQLTAEIAEIAREFGDENFPVSRRMPKLTLELGTDLTDQGVVEWLGSLDAYVNPSYGEGLGIPHIWSKAQGVPLVSSGYGAVGEMVVEIQKAIGATRDHLFPFQSTPVDPEMLKLGLMFERSTRWGTYRREDLAREMRNAVECGRGLDVRAAEYVREAFGADTLGPLRSTLRKIMSVEHSEKWL